MLLEILLEILDDLILIFIKHINVKISMLKANITSFKKFMKEEKKLIKLDNLRQMDLSMALFVKYLFLKDDTLIKSKPICVVFSSISV